MSIGKTVREVATEEARRILGEAIDYRRNHPYVFYLFHAHMATIRRRQRRRFAAWWHRQWRTHYWAKSMATREASRCMAVMEDG